jgi:hypothetical protein
MNTIELARLLTVFHLVPCILEMFDLPLNILLKLGPLSNSVSFIFVFLRVIFGRTLIFFRCILVLQALNVIFYKFSTFFFRSLKHFVHVCVPLGTKVKRLPWCISSEDDGAFEPELAWKLAKGFVNTIDDTPNLDLLILKDPRSFLVLAYG